MLCPYSLKAFDNLGLLGFLNALQVLDCSWPMVGTTLFLLHDIDVVLPGAANLLQKSAFAFLASWNSAVVTSLAFHDAFVGAVRIRHCIHVLSVSQGPPLSVAASRSLMRILFGGALASVHFLFASL